MAYTKTTWVNEVLAGAERFTITDNVGAAPNDWADLAQCGIALQTTVTTSGTPVNATNMNNIEDGIYALSRGAGLSVKGITGSVTGDIADIAAGTDGHVLRRSGAALAFGTIAAAGIADGAVTEGKILNGAVTNLKIGAGAVTEYNLAASSVVAGKIGMAAVTGYALAGSTVENAHLRTSWGQSVMGNPTTGSANPSDIIASADNQVLRRVSGVLGFGTVPNAALVDHNELIYLKVNWPDEAITTGDGKLFFCIPAYLAGSITDFDISITTASSSGLVTVQMANCGTTPITTGGTDILSTRATIDVGEYCSMLAATQPVIANPTVSSGQFVRIDVDVAGTGAKGLDAFFVIEKS